MSLADANVSEKAARAEELQAIKRRRKQVEDRLAIAGLKRVALNKAPRWLDPGAQARLRGFRAELRALGPMFRLFGRYLGTRLDHLEGADCRELAGLSDDAAPMPENEVRARLRNELGLQGATLLAQLNGKAVESLALSQTHRGWLSDGRRVSVKLARTSARSDGDLAILPGLAEHLSSLGWPLPAAHRVLADFASLVARRLDLARAAEGLRRLASLPDEPRLRAPRVIEYLSSSNVLTVEIPQGAPLFPSPDPHDRTEAEVTGRTRILTDLWMRLVFENLQIPEELSRGEVWGLEGGGIELSGGLFHSISLHAAEALWSYLVAAAREDPDEVFYALKQLTTPTIDARPEALRHHLGHVVPRRDGRFGETPPGFPEFLLSHWRQLERHGLVPNPPLLAFYRGLVNLRDLTGPTLSHGVLREALQVAQISRGRRRLRKTLEPSMITRKAEGVVKMLMELPQTLERKSRLERDKLERPTRNVGDGPIAARRVWTDLATGLVLAATLWLWFARVPTLFGGWTGLIQAIALGALGLGLLRRIWKV